MVKKAIIIGAGVAGLSSAIQLKLHGYEVEIYEKEALPGGRMYRFEEKGYIFDVGPTIVMMPDLYKEVFLMAGRNPDDYIPMTLLDPMYSIHFRDKDQLTISSDLTKLMKELERFGEHEAQGYLAYLADVYKRYGIAKSDFLDKSFRKPRDFFNVKSLKSAYQLKTLNSAYSSISRFVKEEKLRQALSFQTLYIGVSPFTGPSIYTIIPMIELLYGIHYIQGGMYSMALGMERLFRELGGAIHYNQPVSEIVIENQQVKGIKVNNQFVASEVVLSNVDFPYAMNHLIKKEKDKGKYTTKKIQKMRYSSSAFILYIGLDKKYENINVHNIYFAPDFKKNIHELFDYTVPQDPSIYLYMPSIIDKTVCDENKSLLYVLVPVPNQKKGNIVWDEAFKETYANHIIQMISDIQGFEDISEHIEVLKIMTPSDFESKFNLQYAATFGLQPSLMQSNYFRPQNRSRTVKGLYFAGSSNHPGAGVPIVLTSAKLAVREILTDEQ